MLNDDDRRLSGLFDDALPALTTLSVSTNDVTSPDSVNIDIGTSRGQQQRSRGSFTSSDDENDFYDGTIPTPGYSMLISKQMHSLKPIHQDVLRMASAYGHSFTAKSLQKTMPTINSLHPTGSINDVVDSSPGRPKHDDAQLRDITASNETGSVGDEHPETVSDILEQLQQHRLIVKKPSDSSSSSSSAKFEFNHDLVRSVVGRDMKNDKNPRKEKRTHMCLFLIPFSYTPIFTETKRSYSLYTEEVCSICTGLRSSLPGELSSPPPPLGPTTLLWWSCLLSIHS